mmetsp:Transcript_39130/g.92051  ORF Transcript_39130/g.92051 Transcript_39130/m.92051 type:complete len:208 (-) Transcript_39130:1742-2365(-)
MEVALLLRDFRGDDAGEVAEGDPISPVLTGPGPAGVACVKVISCDSKKIMPSATVCSNMSTFSSSDPVISRVATMSAFRTVPLIFIIPSTSSPSSIRPLPSASIASKRSARSLSSTSTSSRMALTSFCRQTSMNKSLVMKRVLLPTFSSVMVSCRPHCARCSFSAKVWIFLAIRCFSSSRFILRNSAVLAALSVLSTTSAVIRLPRP